MIVRKSHPRGSEYLTPGLVGEIMRTSTLAEIDYPSSDGKPVAETPLHMAVMWTIIQTLIEWFDADPNVYVWGNMFLYYVEGDITKNVSPDVMIVKGVDKHKDRDVFKTWEEKKSPQCIIEVTSRKTKKEDQTTKFERYRDQLKVSEYFMFDPRADYIKPKLRGFRLRSGDYVPIKEVDGRLPSKVLGLHLEADGTELRFWSPETEAWLLTPAEMREQIEARAERAKASAERAEFERKQAMQQRDKDQSEIERLQRELETIKQQLEADRGRK